MPQVSRVVVCCAVCCLFTAAAWSQEGAQPKVKEFKSAHPDSANAQTVSLNIAEEPMQSAMQMLSDATGFNIIISNKATQGKISAFIRDMEPERALRETIEVNGLHYVRKENVVWVLSDEEFFEDRNLGRGRVVIPLAHGKATEVATVLSNSLSKRAVIVAYPETNVLVVAEVEERLEEAKALAAKLDVPPATRVIQLQYATAADIVQILLPQVANPNTLRADPRTNQIVLTGTEETLERLGKIVREFDKQDKIATRVFPLRYANADATADLLRQVLTGRKQSSTSSEYGSPSGQNQQQMPKVFTTEPRGKGSVGSQTARSASPAPQGAPESGGAPKAASRANAATPVASWESSRATTAPQGNAPNASTTPTGGPQNGSVSPLGGSDEDAALGPLANVTADTRTNSVIVTHVASVLDRVAKIIEAIDVAGDYHTYQFLNVNPKELDVAAKLAALMPVDSPFLQVDPISRKVSFRASPEKAKELIALMKEWDEVIRQVYIEAEILRVNSSLVNELGINWQAATREAANAAASGLSLQTLLVGPTPVTEVNKVNAESVFPANIATTANQGRLTIGNVTTDDYTAVIQALANDSDTQVIAQPKIVARDNGEALFSSTRDEPYTVVSVSGQTNTTMQDVKFLNVGVSLIVAPLIHKDNLIALDTQVEISSLVEVRNNVPVVDRSTARTSVNVQDGGTVLLGGLRQRARTNADNGVPGLRKIPVLGALFGNRKRDRAESEIILVMRPRIVEATMEPAPTMGGVAAEIEKSMNDKMLMPAPSPEASSESQTKQP